MNDPNESIGKTLDAVQQGHAARMVVEFLATALEEENTAIDKEAFRHIRENTLTPEVAQSLWMRRESMRAFVARLHTRIEVGRRAQRVHPSAGSAISS